MANVSGAVRSARVLVLVSAAVVVSFFAATIAAERQADKIARPVDLIVANAMPSVEALSRARAALVVVLVALDDVGGRPSPSELNRLGDRIAADEGQISAAVAAYEALPLFHAERTLASPLDEAMPAFQRSVGDLLAVARGPDALVSGRLAAALQVARERAVSFDDVLARLVEFNSKQGQRLGLEILQTRDHSRALLVLLDCLAAALAVMATFLAVRGLRRTLALLEARRARAELRAFDAEQRTGELDQFSGRLAHDVLGPISVAAMALQHTARQYAGDDRVARMTSRGLAALGRVRALVDALLTFARAGARPEPGASTAVRKVAEDLADGLAMEADAARVELTLDPVPDCTVACSQGVVISLLGNLLRNSIKYMGASSRRQVRLSIRQTDQTVHFQVVDTGPGIPPELRARIFEPYFRAPGTDAVGVGLGLATVERLVRAHDGRLGVAPGEGGSGSTFWFELPRADVPAARPYPGDVAAPSHVM